ncbi:MAG: hypothetical protein AABO58_02130 [Acidobacteriota bacterium]
MRNDYRRVATILSFITRSWFRPSDGSEMTQAPSCWLPLMVAALHDPVAGQGDLRDAGGEPHLHGRIGDGAAAAVGEADAEHRLVLEPLHSSIRNFNDRLQRNLDTVKKFDQPFALYWIKASEDDATLNRSLAQLCRQEDIVCHNRNGEFVAILTGTDQNGVKGFENRISEKLGQRLDRTKRGYSLYNG